MSRLLQVSAGTGPLEVRRFVAALGPLLRESVEHAGHRVEAEVIHGPAEAPRSFALLLAGSDGCGAPLTPWLGTHCRVHASRGRGARRRWYAGVALFPWPDGPAAVVEPGDLEVSVCRAGGPGGQHADKSETAVRIVHRPTGVQVRADGERSRAANRRTAERRLADLLAGQAADRRAQARDVAWRAHHRLERGRPVMTWAGEPLRRQ